MRRIALFVLVLTLASSVSFSGRAALLTVGYIGCSQANNAVSGYESLGGSRFWPVQGAWAGGTVQEWAGEIGGGRWGVFQSMLRAMPPGRIWVQWCTRASENNSWNADAATRVLKEIRRLAPGVPIFVSAQNGYAPPHVCYLTGLDGPPRMELLKTMNLLRREALPGPDVGVLFSRYQTPSVPPLNWTEADGCHANATGRRVLGAALLAFFG